MLVSTRMALSNVFPEAEYTLFVSSSSYEADMASAQKYGIKVAPFYTTQWMLFFALIRRCTGILVGPAYIKNMIVSLEKADVIIDIWGILFADQVVSNTFRSSMLRGFRFVLGKILGKTIIKYTSDLGPFKCKWNRIFSKLYLGHFIDIILARDEMTHKCVGELHIKTPILTVPDTAFLLPFQESHKSEFYAELRKTTSLVGLSVSYQAKNRAANPVVYLAIIKEFVKYLIARYGAHVIIIPNELSKTSADDNRLAEEVCREVADAHCEVLYIEDMSAQEIKGVIRQCDIVVAARYHTIVAAFSLGIPTVAIGWHHKYKGVLELFKQEDSLCDIKNLELKDLIGKFECLWKTREKVTETILSCLPDVYSRIAAGAMEVSKVISKNRGNNIVCIPNSNEK